MNVKSKDEEIECANEKNPNVWSEEEKYEEIREYQEHSDEQIDSIKVCIMKWKWNDKHSPLS